MLLELHNTLQRLIYERGNISPHEVDITFEAPTHERIEKLIQPTINVFLFDLHENIDLRRSDFERTRSNGRAERHTPPRRFDLHYMVSALTTNVEDEHELIWRVLLTLIRHPQLPQEVLPEELQALEPPLSTQVSQSDEGQRLAGVWNALGVPPHPALSYVVTVPVEMNMVIEAPLVLTRTARYTRTHEDRPEISNQIGGVVRGVAGEPLANVRVALEGRVASACETDEEGRFVLTNVSSGAVTLRVTRLDGMQRVVTVQVPSSRSQGSSNPEGTYDIVLEEEAIL
jgi:hypothetical protein